MAMSSSFAPLRELGETQLTIQFALFSAYDARAIGVLAMDSALAAIVTAAATSIGRLWWFSLIGLLMDGLLSVLALMAGGEENAFDVETVFAVADAIDADTMDRAIAIGIAGAITRNREILQTKQSLSSAALFASGITIFSVILCSLTL